MKLVFLSGEKAVRLMNHLNQRYGVPFPVMKEWQWYFHGENVFVVMGSIPKKELNDLNVFSAGMQAFTHATQFVPTGYFISLIGKHITQNTLSISNEQASLFFSGKSLNLNPVEVKTIRSPGFVAVKVENIVIGSAEYKGSHLIPNIPRFQHGKKQE